MPPLTVYLQKLSSIGCDICEHLAARLVELPKLRPENRCAMLTSMQTRTVDVIIIGSGQAAVPLAEALSKRGKRVVLFERGELGGSCINYGCTPSKAFLASAHAAGRARRASAICVSAEVSVDFNHVMQRAHDIVRSFRGDIARGFRAANVEVIHAEARFVGTRTLQAGEATVTAPLVVIDTGTSAAVPTIDGLKQTPYIDNKTIFDLRVLPPKLLVLGAGYIGLELGQGMARCGSDVHLIHAQSRVLEREEPDVSDALQQSIAQDGISIHFNAKATRVTHDGRRFAVTLANGTVLDGDALLVCTGRTPNTDRLELAASGIATDARGYIRIDDQFRTSCVGVFAVGDVAGQPAFTHVAWEDHRRLLDILGGGKRTRNDRPLAYAVFTEPQVGRVALTLEQAQGQGYAARAVTLPLRAVARAIEWNELNGFYRLVIDTTNDRLLGATLVGYEAGEIVHTVLAHIQNGATWHTLDESVHIHPTYNEGLPSAARLFSSSSS
jgi:pyruvate/2-oxoglutarate dehydrogenase complex dihydrolipoamide dehydrogenase (E3) component